MSGLAPYPERPGETECPYYLKTGTCKYASNCKFHHPPDITPSFGPVAPATDVTIGLNKEQYPRRSGETQCTFFLKTGTCKYKMSCKFDHPPEAIQQTLQLQSTPYPVRPGELQCAYYLKTGKCKFGATCRFDHPPLPPDHIQSMMSYYPPDAAIMGIGPGPFPSLGYPLPPLPQRPDEKECTFFLRTGRCQYGTRCKFHHPVDKLPGNLAAVNGLGMPMPYASPGMPGLDPYSGYSMMRPLTEPQLPIRPGTEPCSFYLRTGKCSYGATCRFDHPRAGPTAGQRAEAGNVLAQDQTANATGAALQNSSRPGPPTGAYPREPYPAPGVNGVQPMFLGDYGAAQGFSYAAPPHPVQYPQAAPTSVYSAAPPFRQSS